MNLLNLYNFYDLLIFSFKLYISFLKFQIITKFNNINSISGLLVKIPKS